MGEGKFKYGIGKGKEELWGIGLELVVSVWTHGFKNINKYLYIISSSVFWKGPEAMIPQ